MKNIIKSGAILGCAYTVVNGLFWGFIGSAEFIQRTYEEINAADEEKIGDLIWTMAKEAWKTWLWFIKMIAP